MRKTLSILAVLLAFAPAIAAQTSSNPTTATPTGTLNRGLLNTYYCQLVGGAGCQLTGVITMGSAAFTAASPCRLHIRGTDGAVASFPTLGTKDWLCIENNGNVGISSIISATGSSAWKVFKDGGGLTGSISYDNSADTYTFTTAGTSRGTLNATTLTMNQPYQAGGADSATPGAGTYKGSSSRGGTDSNVAGGAVSAEPGAGTGNAAGAQYLIKVPTPAASGTTQQTYNTAEQFQDFGLAGVQRATITNPASVYQEPNGNIFRVTADFTTASGTFVTITGLSWTMPANHAMSVPFHCEILYSQATAAAANQFGIQDVTVAPTSLMVKADVNISASTFTAANVPALTTTTATSIVTFTPSAITTVWNARIAGFIEQPSNAAESVINLLVLTGNVADSITIKRGSNCVMGF